MFVNTQLASPPRGEVGCRREAPAAGWGRPTFAGL